MAQPISGRHLSRCIPHRNIDELNRLWAKEADSRIDAYARGEIKAISVKNVFKNIYSWKNQSMNIAFLEPAAQEFYASIAFYNLQRQGSGQEFAKEMEDTIERIKQNPEAWATISTSKRARRCLTKRFPFGIIYQIRQDTLLIVAVWHHILGCGRRLENIHFTVTKIVLRSQLFRPRSVALKRYFPEGNVLVLSTLETVMGDRPSIRTLSILTRFCSVSRR